MQKRKWIVFLLVMSTIVTTPQTAEKVWATSAEQKKEEAQQGLNDVNNQIENLNEQQEEAKGKLTKAKAQLEKLIKEQKNLQKNIEKNQIQMELTAEELEYAQEDANQQYEAMKVRIQYMYENSTSNSVLEAIIEADGLIDMLNRLEYVMAVHRSDRELTRKYQETVAVVEAKQTKLREEQDELLFQQEAYIGRQDEMEGLIATLNAEQNAYATQLANAKQQAKAYQETIRKQDEIIRQQQLEAEKNQNNSSQNTGKPNSNVTGMDIVNFARKYVGNPYVWGGNSLTNGADCSGFVHLVYKNFGYSVPRYSMSFLNVGKKVSREDIQPGDIVIYERLNGIGHVAIYMGNGKIVEAQSSATGITDNRSVDCRKIIGIRRIIN